MQTKTNWPFVGVRIPPNTYEALQQQARDKGKSFSEVIREALDSAVSES
jgi:predicted DNA-binding protein